MSAVDVGRADGQVAELRGLLRRHRLVTLGMGGVGKTRLALAVAAGADHHSGQMSLAVA